MHSIEESVDEVADEVADEPSHAPSTPVRHDVVDALTAARDAVSGLLPREVEPRREKSYRDAGPGGWRVWR